MLGDPDYGFIHQDPPRRAESAGVVVRLTNFRVFKNPSTKNYDAEFDFEVERAGDDAKHRFSIADRNLTQLDRMHIVDPSRLLLIGRFSSGAYCMMVLELPEGRIVDRFLGRWPEVSPDNQLVAFVKFSPLRLHDVTAVYLVYDLRKSPDSNRTYQATDELVRDEIAGLPIYPEGSRNLPGDNIGIPEERGHEISSDGFFWLDARTLAFVDRYKGKNSLVIADLSQGLRAPRLSVREIDTRDAIDPEEVPEYMARRPERAFRVTSISFADADREEVRLGVKPIDSLRLPESRFFNLRLPEFRAPGAAP